MKKNNVFIPFQKFDEEQRMVYGYASTETQDNQGEVTKLDTIAKALDDYMKFANIREMHKPNAVGVCKSAEVTAEGLYIGAKVVDDAAWEKVKEGVYKGFSIGGKGKREGNVLTELRLTEISLVDRPANPDCIIDIWKMEGGGENLKRIIVIGDGNVAKGMYSVGQLASLLQQLQYLQGDAAEESEWEMDGSPVPAEFALAINSLAEVLVKMVGEEAAELTATMAAEKADLAADVAKAGAAISKSNMEKIQTMHDHACDLGAACKGVEKMIKTDDVAKLDGLTDVAKGELVNVINKELEPVLKMAEGFAAVQKAIEALPGIAERLAKVEGQPLPSKTKGTPIPVSKTDDTSTTKTPDVVAKSDDVLATIMKAVPGIGAY